ncbi:MAG TPA: DsbA family protein [Tepidisphaeraceae bacterium]|jgi:protein-disulfide isomerase
MPNLTPAVHDRDHSLGPNTAAITLVEYGDYECPDCLNAVPIIQQVRQALGDKLRFVFRHFPRSAIHPHASVAAEAAEAAAAQGKFWEMHQALFDHQKQLGEIDLGNLALKVGLEIYQFEASLSQKRYRQHIAADFESAQQSGVTKTPTFFINGQQYKGPNTADALLTALQAVPTNESV